MSDRTQLWNQLLALSDDEREDIALRLLDSLGDGSTKHERTVAWRDELAVRWRRYQSGETVARDSDEVLDDVARMLKEGTRP